MREIATLKYPKSPEAEDNDDEVNGVCQEHEDVDVGHCAVLRMDEVVEELANREVDLSSSEKKTPKWIEMLLINEDTKGKMVKNGKKKSGKITLKEIKRYHLVAGLLKINLMRLVEFVFKHTLTSS